MFQVDPDPEIRKLQSMDGFTYMMHDNLCVWGFVESWQEAVRLIRIMQESTKMRFRCKNRQPPNFGERPYESNKVKISRCSDKTKTCPIPVIPDHQTPLYILPGVTYYDCHYGPDRDVKKKSDRAMQRECAQNVDHPSTSRSRPALFDTTKVDCPARIYFKEAFAFDVALSQNVMEALQQVGQLRHLVSLGYGPIPTRRIYLKIPRLSSHIGHSVSLVSCYDLIKFLFKSFIK